ncbi:MAG: 1-acyl-sn-glycerol-3-phosphate acyltransferase [Planctomycetes bacterium]|nr:1-acyl-sn-glycerol-3-phosphate acyltransferase [Planctomycetota bacterium]MCW8134277.1 1-acyl-sn-glycerol-3-phosphate acyltransferase [Planctomycetota bacterium]
MQQATDTQESATAYPPPSNAVINLFRTAAAYSLLAVQLAFVLFILEIPYWLADRFLARHRGDAFYSAQRAIARWFFRLYPFGWQRRINCRRDAFPVPCVIVCNHQSMLDILMALMLPVNARWFIKPWTVKIPLMGELNKLAKHIRVDDTEAGDPQRPQGFDTALGWLKDGVSILFFPEGSRSPDGKLKRFKNGAFMLAVEAQVPVVPVVLEGTGACVRKGSPVVHHPDVVMKVLPPVSTKGLSGEMDAARLKADVHERMAAEIAALRTAKAKPGVRSIHGWLTRLGMFGAASVLALLVGLSLYVKNFCIAEPPAFDGDRTLAKEELREVSFDNRVVTRLGNNWRRRREDVNEIALTGTPWQRGYANAKLTPELLEAQEKHLLYTAREFLPNSASFWLVKQLIAVNNRRLPEHVNEREQLEVLGLVEGSVDHYPDEGVPLYHRVLNYHAAHDISHMLIDNPLVTRKELVGCSAIAAWGEASENGDIWVTRNFDWEAGEIFDREKCIIYVWPDAGLAYVHVAWAGMAGAVTGMNEAGISIHLNAARTNETGFGRIGTPVSMLVKRVLENARSIEDAHRILREATVFVADSYMVASRDEKRAVVIEKSPNHCVLREASQPGILLQTNHLLGEPWKDDPVQREQIERATTLQRWNRLEELADKHKGKFNRDVCAAIARDRGGRGGKDVGIGNRNAIDAGICAHSVIMNVSKGEMWVSSGPWTYGAYIHVPVFEMLRAGPGGAVRFHLPRGNDIRRDARFGEQDDLREFRKQLKVTRVNLEAGDIPALEANVRTLRNLNPNGFETTYFQGRLALLKEKPKDAANHFERALEQEPHYEEVREHIRVWLSKAERE